MRVRCWYFDGFLLTVNVCWLEMEVVVVVEKVGWRRRQCGDCFCGGSGGVAGRQCGGFWIFFVGEIVVIQVAVDDNGVSCGCGRGEDTAGGRWWSQKSVVVKKIA